LSPNRLLGGLPLGFYVVAFSGFLFHMGASVVSPILPLHMRDVGATVFQIGSIFSLQAALLVLLRVPLTLVARRVGEKRMLALAFLSESAALLMYGVAPSPAFFWAIPAVQVLATGTFFQLVTAINSNLAPEERQGEALGRHMTIMSIPSFLGPALCGLIVSSLGYRRMFYVSFMFPLAGLALFWLFTRDLSLAGTEVPARQTPTAGSLRGLIANRNFTALAFIRVLYSTGNNTFNTLFSLYAVNQLGFQASHVAALFSGMGVANTAIKIPVGSFSDRVGRKQALLATFAVIILVFIALARFTGYAPIAVAVVLYGAAWGSRATLEWAALTTQVRPEVKNLAMGFMEGFWDLGAAAGGLLAGLLSGLLPVPTIMLLMAGLNVPALPAILLIREKKGGEKR
jgi:DHA1 family multidrug resistance protein-like MFS transporter